MGETKIEWTDKVWNPVTGCTKVSAGCKNCYAERIFHRPYPGRAFTDVLMHPERLEQPLRWRKPCRVFVNSMSDLFHEDIPISFISQCFEVMQRASHHTFQILTKRPQRIHEAMCFLPLPNGFFPKNIFVGVSIEDQSTANKRIELLLSTLAARKFVSYEPALGPVDLTRIVGVQGYITDALKESDYNRLENWTLSGIDWVIAGGESGPHARPSHPDWFRSVRDQCQVAGVPFFFKQWGRNSEFRTQNSEFVGRLLDGREWNEFPSAKSALSADSEF